MYTPEYDSKQRSINHLTGDVPIYTPRRTGNMLIRVLPAFSENGEEPIANWEVGRPSNSEGLGNQHCEVQIVTIFKEFVHYFAAKSFNRETQQFEKSPAILFADVTAQCYEEAKEARKRGYQVDALFSKKAGKWDSSWANKVRVHLVQAFILSLDGTTNALDRRTGKTPVGVVRIPWSAVTDIRRKLFMSTKPQFHDAPASYEDNRLGDYATCGHGRIMAIMPDPADNTQYYVELGDEAPLAVDMAAQLWKPWNQLIVSCDHATVIGDLLSLFSDRIDYIGYVFKDTIFESLLPAEVRRAGKSFTLVKGAPMPQERIAPLTQVPAMPGTLPPIMPPPTIPSPFPSQMTGTAGLNPATSPSFTMVNPTGASVAAPRPPTPAGFPGFTNAAVNPQGPQKAIKEMLDETVGRMPHMGDDDNDAKNTEDFFVDPAQKPPFAGGFKQTQVVPPPPPPQASPASQPPLPPQASPPSPPPPPTNSQLSNIMATTKSNMKLTV